MNELTSFVVEAFLKEDVEKKVVVYGGRFQPFHSGHYATYSHLVKKFGKDNVYIATSDKVSKPKSPFSFKEKSEMMTRMFKIPKSQIKKVKSPYVPTEILRDYDESTTALIVVVGKKDANRLGGKYFEKYDDRTDLDGYGDSGYVYVAPRLSDLSGTEVRNNLTSGSEEDKKRFFKKVYPKFDKTIFDLVTQKLNERIVIPKKVVESWVDNRMNYLLNEATINLGFVTSGDLKKKRMSSFLDNEDIYHTVHKDRAERIGYQLMKHILDKDIDDLIEFDVDLDTNNPSESFIEDVVGRLSNTSQDDFETREEYHEWFQTVINAMALAGYDIIHYKDEYMRTVDGDMEYTTRGLDTTEEPREDPPRPYKDETDDELLDEMLRSESSIRIPKESVVQWIDNKFPKFIQEVSIAGGQPDGDPDDGPASFMDGYDTFDAVAKIRAERIGYEVIRQIMDKDVDDVTVFPRYPDGPIDAVSSFPAGVIGKLTAMNQRDFEDVAAYHDWFQHVTRMMGLAGYELMKFTSHGTVYDDTEKSDKELSTKGLKTLKTDKTAEEKTRVDEIKKSLLTDEEINKLVDDALEELTINISQPTQQQYDKKLKDLEKLQTKLDGMKESDDGYEPVREDIDRISYYLEYYKNLSPTDFNVTKEFDSIRIDMGNPLNERTDIKRLNKSLGIPRSEMPQIYSKDVRDYINFLKRNDIKVRTKKVPVKSVNMTQREINPEKVQSLMGAEIKNLDKPVIMSNDNYILDGHHRVVAMYNLDHSHKLTGIWVDLPIKELLTITKEYPKVSYKSVSEITLTESKIIAESSLQLQVPREIRDIHRLFTKNKKKLYIVGGAVRDAILGKRPKDFDLATDANPDEVLQIAKRGGLSTVEVGKSFGVVVVNGHEIATFRKDIGKGRRPDSVEYTDIEGDVRRRDLTINALFYDLDQEEIVDLVGGIEDLKSKQVKTVGNPKDRFEEDPLRKLRALRFAGQLGGRIDTETEEALNSDPSLKGVSPERIRDEFLKGIKRSKDVSDYLRLADDLGVLSNILPKVRLTKPYINESNYQILLAYLLQNTNVDKLGKYLNKLTYTVEDVRNIKFLIRLLNFDPSTDLVDMKRQQDHVTLTDGDISKFGNYVNKNFDKFLNFNLTVSGKDVVDQGFRGREVGDEIQRREYKNYMNESLNEGSFDIGKGFKFLANKNFQDIKKGSKYIVKSVKGTIGDLQIFVTRLGTRGGKTDEKEINVRSVPEFYKNVIGKNVPNFYSERVNESSRATYSYGCLMLDVPFKGWDALTDKIDEDDVYDTDDGQFGKEDEPHITVLYGLHDNVSSDDVKSLLYDVTDIEFEITGVSLFEADLYDVVKFDIESDKLRELNDTVKSLPHTSTHPTYHPHLTLSYVKSGRGKKYIQEFKKPIKMKSDTFIFSESSGEKSIWEMNENIESLTEGGAYGHMNHPFDQEINLTFGDLKEIVNKGLDGELDLAREKTDGQALAVSWRDGKLIAARNKGHLKNRGENAMDIHGVADKFGGRGELTKAYNSAMRDLSSAIGSLSDKQREKIFKGGACFMNLEVIYPSSVNVIPYGQPLLVFHGTMEFDEDGNAIGENQPAGRILAGMIKQVNQNVQDTYTIQGPPVTELPKKEDLSKLKSKYMKQINNLQREFRLKDSDGVNEYHRKWWESWIEKNSPERRLDPDVKDGLIGRWALDDKSFRLNGKNIENDKVLDWAKKVDKGDKKKIQKENLRKFEDIFLGIGADILSFMSSVLVVNPDKSIRSIKKRFDKAVDDIRKGGDERKIDKLKQELERLNQIGGMDKLVPNEGIVFTYQGYTLKLTGVFAPLNQILGLMYY